MALTAIPGIYKPLSNDMGMPRTLTNPMVRPLGPTAINSGNTTGNTGAQPFAQVVKPPSLGSSSVSPYQPPDSLSGFGSAADIFRGDSSVSPMPKTPTPVAQGGFFQNLVGAFPPLFGGSTGPGKSIAAPFGGGTPSDANSGGGYSPAQGSNTAGGGATYSDANSNPSGDGYLPVDQTKMDSNFINDQIKNDQQFQYDLTNISGQQRNLMDALTALGTQGQIASGFQFDPAEAAKLGFKMPGTFTDAMGNTIDASQALTSALTGANGLAAANPFSQKAQIDYATKHALNAQDAQMVAHGLARSGDFQDAQGNYVQGYDQAGNPVGGPGGYQHQATMYQQNLANYNAMQSFLGKLASGESDLTSGMSKSFDSISTARNSALTRILALINAGAFKLPSQNTPPAKQPNPGNDPTTNPWINQGGAGSLGGPVGGSPPVPGPNDGAPPAASPYYFNGGQGTYSDANSSPSGSGYAATPPGSNPPGTTFTGGQGTMSDANSGGNGYLPTNNAYSGGWGTGTPGVPSPPTSNFVPPSIINAIGNSMQNPTTVRTNQSNPWSNILGQGDQTRSLQDAQPYNDGEYDAWVAAGGDNPIVPFADTGSVLGDAQASWMANTPNPDQIYKQYGLSPDIGMWRT